MLLESEAGIECEKHDIQKSGQLNQRHTSKKTRIHLLALGWCVFPPNRQVDIGNRAAWALQYQLTLLGPHND
jgi:hypothetical protein